MKNYRKLSLLFLLSVTMVPFISAKMDTSGRPSPDDFDDPSCGPLTEDDAELTTLEKEAVKGQKNRKVPMFPRLSTPPTPAQKKPAVAPAKTTTVEDEFSALKKRINAQRIDQEDSMRGVARTYQQAMQQANALESNYETRLSEIQESRSLTRWEKVGAAVVLTASAAAFLAQEAEQRTASFVVAVISGIPTLIGYRRHKNRCDEQEASLNAATATQLEVAIKGLDSWCASDQTRALIERLEEYLAELSRLEVKATGKLQSDIMQLKLQLEHDCQGLKKAVQAARDRQSALEQILLEVSA